MSAPLVTLLSDFGTADGYVGAMKAGVLSRCREARLIDLAHEIEPGCVLSGAWVLAQAAPRFPEGCVHLAVVDPGVGSDRRAIACRIDDHIYVAPDNGLLEFVLRGAESVASFVLSNEQLWNRPVSSVFQGRDLFAPVAGFLAAGGAIEASGTQIPSDSLVRLPAASVPAASLPVARVEVSSGRSAGRVVHVDRFGNLITDLPLIPEAAIGRIAEVGSELLPVVRTYSDVATGALLALVGSSGTLEVACNGGSAQRRVGISVGDVVLLRDPPGVELA
ncbi:MAG: SAM-dependent chlorinase/fluorinase [bacterium]|nr:SAM-dependent chlorinase/fluorinase [bacterium]